MKQSLIVFLFLILSFTTQAQKKVTHSSLTRDLFYIASKGESRSNLVGMPKKKIQRRSKRVQRKKALSSLKGLIKNGADINHKTSLGETPLMAASRIGFYEAVNLFLNSGSNVNQKDKKGNTALIMAAKNNRLDVVKALLKGKADRSIKNKFGQTALDLSFDSKIQNYLENYK